MPDVLRLRRGLLDLAAGVLRAGDGETRLTRLEREFLEYLADRPGQVVSPEQLLVDVWQYAPGVRSRAVANTVSRLRGKLEVDPSQPDHLVSVFGIGYRLDLEEELDPGLDGFVGRQRELGALVFLLRTHDVVTLTGPSGVGKTTLARQLCATRRSVYADGIAFCRLLDCASKDAVISEIGRAFGVRLEDGDPTAQLARVLGARPDGLLVLDNAEHVVDVVEDLLAAWSGVRHTLLVTSRERLSRGEGLELGPLASDSAAELYARRATVDRADDDPDVARLVAELDHLPLAITLAAAQSSILTPAQMLERLDRRMRLLRPRVGAEEPALEAAIQWSWDLLDADRQRALASLSVFRGFDLDAAEAVLGEDAAVHLAGLVDSSLVHRDGGRFGILSSIRMFARERLSDPARILALHAAWFARRGAELASDLQAREAPGTRAALLQETGNLEVAFDNSTDPDARACVGAALSLALQCQGRCALALQTIERFDGADLSPELRFRAALDRLRVLNQLGDMEPAAACVERVEGLCDTPRRRAEALYQVTRHRYANGEALDPNAIERILTDERGLSETERAFGLLALRDAAERSNLLDRARSAALDAVVIFRRVRHDAGLSTALFSASMIEVKLGRPAEALVLVGEAAEAARRLGDPGLECASLRSAMVVSAALHDNEEGRARGQELLQLARRSGLQRYEVLALWGLGVLEPVRAQAEQRYREGRAVARRMGDRDSEARLTGNIAVALHLQGRFEECLEPYAEAVTGLELVQQPWYAVMHAAWRAIALAALGRAEEARAALDALPMEAPRGSWRQAAYIVRFARAALDRIRGCCDPPGLIGQIEAEVTTPDLEHPRRVQNITLTYGIVQITAEVLAVPSHEGTEPTGAPPGYSPA